MHHQNSPDPVIRAVRNELQAAFSSSSSSTTQPQQQIGENITNYSNNNTPSHMTQRSSQQQIGGVPLVSPLNELQPGRRRSDSASSQNGSSSLTPAHNTPSPAVTTSTSTSYHQNNQVPFSAVRRMSTSSINNSNNNLASLFIIPNLQQQQQQQQNNTNGNDDYLERMSNATSNNTSSVAAVAYAYQHHNPNPEFHRTVVTEAEIEDYSLSYPRLHAWQIYNVCCEFDDEDERIARLDRLDSWGSVLGPLVQTHGQMSLMRQNNMNRTSSNNSNNINNAVPAENGSTHTHVVLPPLMTMIQHTSQNDNENEDDHRRAGSFSPLTGLSNGSNGATPLRLVPQQQQASSSTSPTQQNQQLLRRSSYALVVRELQARLAESITTGVPISSLINNNNNNNNTNLPATAATSTGARAQNAATLTSSTNPPSSTESSVREFQLQYPRLPRTVIQRVLSEIPMDTGRRSALNSLSNWLTIMNTSTLTNRQALNPVITRSRTSTDTNATITNNNNNNINHASSSSSSTATTTSTLMNVAASTSNIPSTPTTTTTTNITWCQTTRSLRRAPNHLSLLRELTETAPRFRWDAQFQQRFPDIDPALVRRNQRLYQRREDCLRFREMFPGVPSAELERIVREEVSDEIRVNRLTKMVHDLEHAQLLRERDEAMERQQRMAVNASKKNCCDSDKCVVCNELKRLEMVLMKNGVGSEMNSPKRRGESKDQNMKNRNNVDDDDKDDGDEGDSEMNKKQDEENDVVLLCELHQRQLLFAQQQGVGAATTTNIDENSNNSNECYVCMAAPRSHVIYPCGHKCFCSICATHVRIEACPICRKPIKDIFKVFD